MPNIIRADCGFDPTEVEKFEEVTVELLNDPSGWTLMDIVTCMLAWLPKVLMFPSKTLNT